MAMGRQMTDGGAGGRSRNTTSAWQGAANKAQKAQPATTSAWQNAASSAQRNAPPRPAAPRPAAPRAAAPRSAPPAYNTSPIGGGGGGGGYAPQAAVAAPPPPPPPPSQQDYMAGDEVFKAQQASLQKALSDYMAQDTADISRYGEDYGKAVDGLGYRAPVVDNPATTMDESLGGGWNYEDQNTSSGRAYQNQVNDFAGRGMLQSTMYSTALDNLNRSLNEQYTGLNTAKTNFTNDKSRARTAYQNENTSAGQGAKADSMARYAAIYGAL